VDFTHLHTILSSVLDGQNTTKHVCIVPWCGSLALLRKQSADPVPSSVNVAISFMIPNAPARASPTQPRLLTAISLLVFAGVVFRSEVALLLVPVAIHAMSFVVPPLRVIKTGLISATVSIGKDRHHFWSVACRLTGKQGLTILVDSYFWGQHLLWPELYAVYFNVYQGKSSDWGVSRHSFQPSIL
jgi:alpha-1,6-mannosyltransferase